MLGYSVEPGQAAEVALQTRDDGFTAQKWFFRHGPADGSAGMEKNLALVKALREALGDFYPLMFDAFTGWDTAYAIQMARAMEPFCPTWLEEPVPAERLGAFRKLKAATRVPLATGEHVYTRWQAKELLSSGAVDVLQNDPDWTGGISELTKICALGSAFETPVIAHGHSLLAALHVAGAESPNTVPYVEHLIRHQNWKQFFFRDPAPAQGGSVRVPTTPGLGLDLDPGKVEQTRELE
jgi:L-alanine-DL-glutamate epimerase-like enolase superfamily enzyme